MNIDSVIEAVTDKEREVYRTTDEVPKLVVYMERDFWHQCMGEISGRVELSAVDFYQKMVRSF